MITYVILGVCLVLTAYLILGVAMGMIHETAGLARDDSHFARIVILWPWHLLVSPIRVAAFLLVILRRSMWK